MTKNANHSLFAIWKPLGFDLYLDPNLGANTGDLAAGADLSGVWSFVTFGGTVGKGTKPLPTLSRNGYKFSGWYTAPSGGSKVTDKTKINAAGDRTLYARWTPKKVTVILDYNDKALTLKKADGKKTVNVNYGSSFSALPKPALAGHRFWKWTEEKEPSDIEGAPALTDMIAGPGIVFPAKGNPVVTVSAQWNYTGEDEEGFIFGPSQHKVSLDLACNDASHTGTAGTDWTADSAGNPAFLVTYVKNTKAAPAHKYEGLSGFLPGEEFAPVRAGYSFSGWYTAVKGGSKVTSLTNVTKFIDHSLYARWAPVKCTISFDVSDTGYAPVNPKAKAYVYGAAYKSLPVPKRSGYAFSGWYYDTAGGEVFIDKRSIVNNSATGVTAGTAVLNAKWTPRVYKITYHANGGHFGAGISSVKIIGTYDSSYTVPWLADPCYLNPAKNKTSFLGYYTAKKGGKQIVAPDGTVNVGALIKTATNHTLYAQWG